MPIESSIRLADGDHVVQFYDGDDDLVDMVSGYLAAAVLDGDAVVVIAVPDHQDAFRAALAAAGVDVEAARDSGRLTVLDAAQTLARFMVDGSPEPRAFGDVVGGLVGPTVGHGRRVRVYGEMVALLWDAGNVAGAIELERMWNELATRVPFALFCAYPVGIVTGERSAADGFAQVCLLHSDVVVRPPVAVDLDVRRTYAGTSEAVRSARRFVDETLRRWGRVDLVTDAKLIVSELATNAVVHSCSDFSVALSRSGNVVRIGVADSGADSARPRNSDSLTLGGRGLRLVDAIANRWGQDAVEGGKTVWADLAVRPEA